MADTFMGLEVKDWITSAAVVLGPILAVQAQKLVERIRDKQERRLKIFKTLITTRAERVSRDHVQALNMIVVEFYGRRLFGRQWQNSKEKSVTDAWNIYVAHLYEFKNYESVEAWSKRSDDLFTELLYIMSLALDYNFDKVQLKSGVYKPTAHVDLENAQLAVLNGWAKILNNEKSLRMEITNLPPPQPPAIS